MKAEKRKQMLEAYKREDSLLTQRILEMRVNKRLFWPSIRKKSEKFTQIELFDGSKKQRALPSNPNDNDLSKRKSKKRKSPEWDSDSDFEIDAKKKSKVSHKSAADASISKVKPKKSSTGVKEEGACESEAKRAKWDDEIFIFFGSDDETNTKWRPKSIKDLDDFFAARDPEFAKLNQLVPDGSDNNQSDEEDFEQELLAFASENESEHEEERPSDIIIPTPAEETEDIAQQTQSSDEEVNPDEIRNSMPIIKNKKILKTKKFKKTKSSELKKSWPHLSKLKDTLKKYKVKNIRQNSIINRVKNGELPLEFQKESSLNEDKEDFSASHSISFSETNGIFYEVQETGEASVFIEDEEGDSILPLIISAAENVANNNKVVKENSVCDIVKKECTTLSETFSTPVSGKRSSRRSQGRASELASLRKAMMDM